ncbi:MAG: hypothetical protein AB1Z98_33150, partial [Nannocystaceae bacterium]
MTASYSDQFYPHFVAWKSRTKGYLPQVSVDGETRTVSYVTEDVALVRARWVYVLATPVEGSGSPKVVRELFIDAAGRVWTTSDSPTVPLHERPLDPAGRKAAVGAMLPRLGTDGQPHWLRIIYSPFQLPSHSVRRLTYDSVHDQIVKMIPPLWSWERSSLVGRDAEGTMQVGSRWTLHDTPIRVTDRVDGAQEGMPSTAIVAVGLDIVEMALRWSDVYVARRGQWQEEFEPVEPHTSSPHQRLALARLLDDIIVSNDAARAKLGKHLDIGAINDAIVADDEARHRLLKKVEDAAAQISRLVANPLFMLFVTSAMDTEEAPEYPPEQRLIHILDVLARCTEDLGQSQSGQLLLHGWATQANEDPDHFTHHFILPTTAKPPEFYFKAFRWSSKSIMSVLTQYASHRVAVARATIKEDIAETIIRPFAALAEHGFADGIEWFDEAFDARRYIKDVGLVDEAVDTFGTTVRWQSLEISVQTSHFHVMKKNFIVVDQAQLGYLERWIEAGADTDFGRGSKVAAAKVLLGTVLDGVNLGLALNDLRTSHPNAYAKAFAYGSVAAQAVGLSVSVAEALGPKLGVSEQAMRGVRYAGALLRGVTSAFFAIANFRGASKAFARGDYDNALAKAAAGAADLVSAFAFFYTAAVVNSFWAPWILLIAGLVSAVSPLVAALLEDDPLSEFLENCEWGSDPYNNVGLKPKWAEGVPVAKWRNKYGLQQRTLVRMIGRFTVSAKLQRVSNAGLWIELSTVTPTSKLTVT